MRKQNKNQLKFDFSNQRFDFIAIDENNNEIVFNLPSKKISCDCNICNPITKACFLCDGTKQFNVVDDDFIRNSKNKIDIDNLEKYLNLFHDD